MKPRLFFFSIVTLSLLFFNCSNNDIEKYEVVPKFGFESITDLETAIDTLHVDVAHMVKWNTYFVLSWAGDDITTFGLSSIADYWGMDKREQWDRFSRTDAIWRESYDIIIDINNMLYNANGFEVANAEDKDRLLGQAYFIRGVLYHHLVRVFKTIPLQLGTEIDIDKAISNTADVYRHIESDYLKAASLLPAIYPGSEMGAPRPNKGSARAFLSRLYLDWAGYPVKDVGKYELAASTAKQVIDAHGDHGFGLVNDLDDLWTIEHRFNKESVYTVVHCTACPQGGNYKTGKIGIPTELGGWGQTFAEIKFFETFPDNHRKNATYITDFELNDPYSNPPGGPTLNWVNFPEQKDPLFAKITGKGDISRETHENDRNTYMMRYAEVLLIFAEASARAGNSSPEAWEALNKIRRRAELLPPDEPNVSVDVHSGDLVELAFQERGWEFAGEFLRWFDLVRTERVEEFLNESYRNDISSVVTDSNNKDYGHPLKEFNNITGSLGPDNYFAPFPEHYKELYIIEEEE
ncbi:RagB/SusD family nutrient uptake outer membrane protein [Seonamhaeicola sp.]|uniref:RagB/SusD family nutrient uptake outer membrane protein n=1 Tax=Seonamhaeicola sp. TaxID=1912245 RepID=UPI00263779F8|nr:RagB/SusD family nutrient uptake outer membrane protein [Seonamhaeicola sp.]